MEKRVPKGRKMWTVQIDENGGVHIPKEALALTEICVPVLRAAGCVAAVSGESEAAQEERALGI